MELDGSDTSLAATVGTARGFVFDMDGTILDSQEAHYRSWDRATREGGFPHPRSDIFAEFGKTTEAIAVALCPGAGAREVARVARLKESYFLEDVPALALFEGINELFSTIKASGKRACIASSNDDRTIDAILHHVKLDALVDGFVGLDGVSHGKPHPEMILKSAAKMSLAPEECIVVGDTAYDILAGNSAGAYTVGVLTGTFSRAELVRAGARMVVRAAADLLPLVKS